MLLKIIAEKLPVLKPLAYQASLQIRADKDMDGFQQVFDGKVVIVQTHSDDALIYAGNTAALINSLSPEAELVTLVADEAGVTDQYAEEFQQKYLQNKYAAEMPLDMLKRMIRNREAEQNAREMGFVRHINFDFSWPVIKPVYENGQLISNLTEYKRPSKNEFTRICDFVVDKDAKTYLLATPFSRHQQHRQATKLFMDAIRKYSPGSQLFFWSDEIDKTAANIQDNVIVYYSAQDEQENMRRIFRSNDSQNTRRGGNYYGEKAEYIARFINAQNPLPFFQQAHYEYAEGFFAERFVY